MDAAVHKKTVQVGQFIGEPVRWILDVSGLVYRHRDGAGCADFVRGPEPRQRVRTRR